MSIRRISEPCSSHRRRRLATDASLRGPATSGTSGRKDQRRLARPPVAAPKRAAHALLAGDIFRAHGHRLGCLGRQVADIDGGGRPALLLRVLWRLDVDDRAPAGGGRRLLHHHAARRWLLPRAGTTASPGGAGCAGGGRLDINASGRAGTHRPQRRRGGRCRPLRHDLRHVRCLRRHHAGWPVPARGAAIDAVAALGAAVLQSTRRRLPRRLPHTWRRSRRRRLSRG